jgi:hypothetical protein
MFVQVIQSKGGDPGAIRDRMDVWVKELGPGADGWLGSTAGYGTDGSFVAVARSGMRSRTGESQDLPEDMKAQMEEWGKLTEDVRFIDLKEPWMWSP